MNFFMKISIIYFLLFYSSSLAGQEILRLRHNSVIYNGNHYHINQLDEVLKDDYLAYSMYMQSRDRRRLANIFGGITIAAMAVGTGVIGVNSSSDTFFPSDGEILGFILWGTVVPIFGTIGVIMKLSSNKKLNKSLKLFNQAALKDIGSLHSPILELSLSGTQNGVGFVLQF